MMNRRRFIGQAAMAGLATALSDWRRAFAAGTKDEGVGRPWKGWTRGELQAHFIYTGRAESTFLIFPDGTTMLVDSGDYDVPQRVLMQTPVLPNRSRGAGEWIARYVQRANPFGNKVDYMMLTHWHADHAGCETSYSRREERDGDDWFVSGFAETCDFIDFGKAFDRCWPDLNDPFPLKDRACREVSQISRMYRYLERHKGLKVEKFRVGARDQVVLLKDPGAFPDFQVRNICGNGKILMRDGSIRNLYEGIFTPSHTTGYDRDARAGAGREGVGIVHLRQALQRPRHASPPLVAETVSRRPGDLPYRVPRRTDGGRERGGAGRRRAGVARLRTRCPERAGGRSRLHRVIPHGA